MKKQLFYLLVSLCLPFGLAAQCQNLTLPFGQVSVDINRGHKIIATQDGHFVIAGEWNNEAYLMKVNHEGTPLILKKFGTQIGGESLFKDVVESPDGGFVAVGQCDNCTTPNDSLVKVVVLKTDASLNLDATIGVKKFGSTTQETFTSLNERFEPCIVRTGNEYLLAAGINTGADINAQNTVVTRLNATLQTVWEKWYNAGYFEVPYDIVATNDGFIMTVNRAFLPTAALLKIDSDGNLQYIQPFTIDPARNIVYLPDSNQIVVVGERTPVANNRQLFLLRFNAANGAALDSLTWGETLWDEGQDVQLLENGNLLVGARITLPNVFGTYGSSRVYRVQTRPLQVLCYEKIPNPNDITTMSLTSVVPLSAQGSDYAVAGIRGLNNRTFFHIREDCGVHSVNATICSGDTYTLPDGQIVNQSGVYETNLQAAFGCDSLIQTTVTVALPVVVESVDIQHDNNNGNGAVSLQQISGGTGPYTFHWSNNASGNAIGSLVHGTYTVTITDASGCTAVASFTVEMQVATDDPFREVDFSMYPNPFVSYLNVSLEMSDFSNTRYELRLIDAQGKLCRQYTLQPGQAELLDIGELPSGVYSAQLLEGGKPMRQLRVVKR